MKLGKNRNRASTEISIPRLSRFSRQIFLNSPIMQHSKTRASFPAVLKTILLILACLTIHRYIARSRSFANPLGSLAKAVTMPWFQSFHAFSRLKPSRNPTVDIFTMSRTSVHFSVNTVARKTMAYSPTSVYTIADLQEPNPL